MQLIKIGPLDPDCPDVLSRFCPDFPIFSRHSRICVAMHVLLSYQVSLKDSKGLLALNGVHEEEDEVPHRFKFERCPHKLSATDKKLLASCWSGQVLDLVLRVKGAVKGANGITFKGEKDERKGDMPRSMFQLANGKAVGTIQYFCVQSGAGIDHGIESLVAKVKLHRILQSMRTQHSQLPIFSMENSREAFIPWNQIGPRVAFQRHAKCQPNQWVALRAP
jgi:hypothetical protein